MKDANLNKNYIRLLLQSSFICMPVVALLIVLIDHSFSLIDRNIVIYDWLLNLVCLCINWYTSLHLLAAIRNSSNMKLYQLRIIYRYALITLLVPLFVSGIIFWCFHALFCDGFPSFYAFLQLFLNQLAAGLIYNLCYDIFLLSKQKNYTEEKMEQLEVLKVKAEVDMLKAQLNPHFIYNSLNILSYLTSTNPTNAQSFINLFSKIYRYVLVNISQDWITLEKEMIIARDYIDLQKIRSGNAVQMVVVARKKNTISSYFIPPLSLQLLIENAIKHNAFSNANPLVIYLEMDPDCIIVRNKVMIPEQKRISTGFGLSNLNERYKLLAGKQIRVLQDEDHFSVFLPIFKSIPI